MRHFLVCLFVLLLLAGFVLAQPQPGDLLLSSINSPYQVQYLDQTTGVSRTLSSTWPNGFPNWVTMAADNREVAALSSGTTDTFELVTPSGTHTTLANFGNAGSPNGIDLDQLGDYLVSSSDQTVRRVKLSGSFTTITTAPATLNNLAFNPDNGNTLLGIFSAGLLLESDENGTIIKTIASGLGSVSCIDPLPQSGNFVIGTFTSPNVRVISPTGAVVTTWTHASMNGVKVDDATGDVYCVGSTVVGKYTANGVAVKSWMVGGMNLSAVEVYASRQVVGSGTAVPGTPYSVQFSFPGYGNSPYVGALSFSQRPGINLRGSTVNLAFDPLLILSLQGLFVSNFQGILSNAGQATGTINIPSVLPKGITFFCSGVALSGSTVATGNTIGITTR
jgi:hypothetical protein